ncbi:Calx-beta domain-containing protein [Acanthopleuribacter pedis]|uniref:PKD domain-containing protein n=1 Tax=Acanthopleuribacter pedis TaxID=442870 RepID=A0A8J7Q995_9BACT|nr:Calx-beta domain-containing protein [Acanthopleuribacter pedis]MBO1319779.1 PKD domain-containing protein [Acanthopleuribacter pedis]
MIAPFTPRIANPLTKMWLCLLLGLAGFSAQAAPITWSGAGDGTNFGDPANWSPAQVPGPADEALMNVDTPISIIVNGSFTIQRFELGVSASSFIQALTLQGGSQLIVTTGTSTQENTGRITFAGNGELSVNPGAVVNLGGTIQLNDMRFSGGGTVNFISGANTVIPAPFTWVIDSTTVVLASQLDTITGLNLELNNSAAFTVNSGVDMALGGTSAINTTTGPPGIFTVNGTLHVGNAIPAFAPTDQDRFASARKLPPTILPVTARFDNGGFVEIGNSFELQLGGDGTHTGTFNATGSENFLVFTGGVHGLDDTVFGNTRIDGGTLNLTTDIMLQTGSFIQNGGVIDCGGNTLTIELLYDWQSGEMRDGPVTTQSVGSLTFSTGGLKALRNSTLTLDSGGGVTGNGVIELDSASIINNGTFNIASDGQMQTPNSGTFINQNTLTKSQGGDFDFGVSLSEAAGPTNINANAARLIFSGGGVMNSTLATSAGNAVEFTGNLMNILSSPINNLGEMIINGPVNLSTLPGPIGGVIRFDNGSIAGTGTLSSTGSFLWSGGSMTGPYTVECASGCVMQIQGGNPKELNTGAVLNNNGGTITIMEDAILGVEESSQINHDGGTFSIYAGARLQADPMRSPGVGSLNLNIGASLDDSPMSPQPPGTVTEIMCGLNLNSPLAINFGELRWGGPGSVGSGPTLASGTVFTLFGENKTISGANFSGPGVTTLQGGTITVGNDGFFLAANAPLNLEGATITGPGQMNAQGTVNWTDGGFDGLGAGPPPQANLTGPTAAISGTSPKFIRGGYSVNLPTGTAWSDGNIEMDGTSILNVPNGATLNISGTTSIIVTGGTPTFLGDPTSIINLSATGIFVNDALADFRGTLNVNNGNFSQNGGGLVPGSIVVSPGTRFEGNTATLTFTGGISGGGDVAINGTTATFGTVAPTFTGSLSINTATVNVNVDTAFSNVIMNSGTLQGTGIINLNGIMNWAGGTLAGSGAFNVQNTAVLQINGGDPHTLDQRPLTVANGGTLRIEGGATLSAADTTVTINTGGLLDLQSGNIIPAGGGGPATLNVSGNFNKSAPGDGTVSLPTTLAGTMALAGNTLTFTDTFAVTTGAGINLEGAILGVQQPFTLVNGAAMNGPGTMQGSLTNNGTVTVGDGGFNDALTISTNYTQGAGGTLSVNIQDNSGSTALDQLIVSGTAVFGGTLAAAFPGNFEPPTGVPLPVVTFTTRGTGDFANTSLTSPAGSTLDVVYEAGAVTLVNGGPATAQWTGGAGGDWHNPANWDGNAVPGPNTAVTIDLSVTVTINTQPAFAASVALGGAGNPTLAVSGQILDTNSMNIFTGATLRLVDSFLGTPGGPSPEKRGNPLTNNGSINVFGGSGIGLLANNASGGLIQIAGDTTNSPNPGVLILESGLTNSGQIILTSQTATDSGIGINNGGLFTNDGSMVIDAAAGGNRLLNLQLINNGTFVANTDTFFGGGGGASTKRGAVTILNNNNFSLAQATLNIDSGDIRNSVGATLNAEGSIQFAAPGNGFVNEGTLRIAGTGTGTLQIGANLVNTGTLEFDLDGLTPLGSDRIDISGTANLGGTLTTTFTNDPQDGTNFTLLQYTALLGDFTTRNITPPQGLDVTVDAGTTAYTLSFGTTPPITDPQVYVLDVGIPGIVSLDAANNTENRVINTQVSGSGVTTTPTGDRLYVVSPNNGTVTSYATTTNVLDNTLTDFPTAFAAAVTPDNNAVWFLLGAGSQTAKRGLGEIGVYTQLPSSTRTLNIPCATAAQAIVFNPVRREAYTVGSNGSVCAIDTSNDSLIQSAGFTASFSGAVVDPAGAFLYAFDPNQSQMFRIDLSDLSGQAIAVPGSPYQGAIYNNRLFITTQTANIQIFDLSNDSLTALPLPGAGGTMDISIFDAGPTAYVTDSSGTVLTFDPDGGSVLNRGGGSFVNPVKVVDTELRPLGTASIALSSATFSVNEDAGSVTVSVSRAGVAWETIGVSFSTADGTALAGQDYTLTSNTLNFANGNETLNISIPIIDDTDVEASETFTVSISGATNNGVITLGSATVTIVDNDNVAPSGTVQFSSAAYNVTEGEETVTVTVVRGNDDSTSSTTASVTLTTSDGSAVAGLDYLTITQTVTFPPGTNSVDVTIPILDDTGIEEIEQFRVSLQNPVEATLGTPSNALVLIGDNDFQTVAWTQAAQTVTEGTAKTTVAVTAVLGSPNPGLLTVPFSIGGSATAGVDHTLTQGTLTFEAGATTATLRFTVIEDSVQEGPETIRLQLLPATVVPVVPATHLITILDDDDGTGTDGTDGGDGGDGGAPDTSITSPQNDAEFTVGQAISFQATGSDPQQELLSYTWEICSSNGNCRTLSGASVTATFREPGIYVALCYTTDTSGNRDLSPARVRIRVREALPPRIEITQPTANLLNLTQGDSVNFIATTSEENVQVRWYFISDPGTDVGQGRELTLTFPQEGRFTLVAEARGPNGLTASDYVNVLVSLENLRPVLLTATSPEPASVFSVGEVINFEAQVSNPDTRKKELEFFWDFGDGTQLEGIAVTNSFNRPGRYRATVVARDVAEDVLLQDSVAFYVFGTMPPVVDINLPTDVQIEPFGAAKRVPDAGTIYFEARVRDPRGFRVQDLTFFWDFGDGRTSNQQTPGRIVWADEGTFTVSLFARTRNGLVSETVRRTITVREVDENTFEPNETFGQAKPLPPGNYDRQTLPDINSADVYRITVDRNGQSIVVKIDIDGTVRAELYDGLQNPLNSRIITNQGSIQLNGLSAGDYFLRITQIAGKDKRMLSYGFSVSVLNPGLYLADIQSNETFTTEIGIVNTTNSEISVEAIAYDASGNILARAPFTLAGNGRTHQEVSQFFDGEQLEIAWVQVDATGDIAGYARTCSRDGKEEYLVTAGTKLSNELFVPHIAEKVDQWFTRASVVNATDSETSAIILTQSVEEGSSADLTLRDKFTQDQFDFVDRFGGALPNDRIWAKMSEAGANNVLVGSEVFGTIDGSRVSAGLELVDTGQDNPNFTFVPNTLYFTHIARDIDQFWTGITLVNIGDVQQGVRIAAYGPAGNFVNNVERTLEPNEKLVVLARDLLAPIGSPADIDWLEVVADADVVGFELFGTNNQKQMAGLEATTGVKPNVCFPFYDSTNRSFQGISVVNVNDTAQNVTFTLYDNQGEVIATATRQLAARQKLVETISELLPQSEWESQNALPGWLEATAQGPLAGFQLIISKDGEQMSALKAQ